MSSSTEPEALCKQGRRCLRKGDLAKALELFRQVLEVDDRDILAHEGIAAASFAQNDYDTAAEHFKRVSQLDPRQGRALINLGAVYNRMGDYNKAIGVLRKGISKEQKSGEGYYNLGLAYRGLNQPSMAVSAYREAVRIAPDMAAAHQNLANVFVDMGNFQQAIIHYKKALEINPEFDRAKRGLARAKETSTQVNQSISPFGRLVDTKSYRRKATPQMERELTDLERLQDRSKVFGIVSDVESAANLFLKQFREEFEPALGALNRAVAQAGEAPTAVSKAYRDYQSAFKRCYDLRRALKRAVIELRAHEEMMNTPELKPKK